MAAFSSTMAGELLELMFENDKTALPRVLRSFTNTIQVSFRQDRSTMTAREVRRRFAICERAFRELRSEHGWGLERALDALPRALRSKLDGTPFDPTAERTLWAPGDGSVPGLS